MNLLLLKPTAAHIGQASQFASVYAVNGFGKNVLHVSHEEYIHFIRIGKLCEIVFVDFLRQQKIIVSANDILTPHSGNHRKGADFILMHSNQEVDIKAANKSFHKRILIREDQFQAHVHDIYIGAKYVSDSCIEYHGYITGEEMKKVKPKDYGYGLCRAMFLDELKPMSQFIELCKKENRVA
jgi:hypothetical protein